MLISAGTRLGPYEIRSLLGAGGMGEVYKAHDTRLGRDVAIKVSKAQFSERFEREARAVAAINHPHVCPLYDVGPDYLVMEYIEGVPLKGPLPLDQALKYGAQICDALFAAHKKGVTHRDLKPANILITKAGIKLLDFGLARQTAPLQETDATQALTKDGAIVGTLSYMSPEQLRSKETGPRSDIFAFGLVLYEMITGKRAFEGASSADVIAAIIERPAPSVAKVAPPLLDRALKRCLEKDPDDRWQSARDLKAELEWIAATAGEPALSGDPRSPAVTPNLRWWRLATLLAITACVITIAGGAWSMLRRPSSPAPRLRLALDIPVGERGNNYLFSPDGTKVAFEEENGTGVLFLDSLETRILDPNPSSYVGGWSPDSRSLMYIDPPEIRKASVSGGPSQLVCSCGAAGRGLEWLRDGTILFNRTSDGGTLELDRVSENGGSPMTEKGTPAFYPAMLPDGRHYLFLSPKRDTVDEGIYVGLLGSKDVIKVTEANSKAVLSSGHLLFLRGITLMAQPFDTSAFRLTAPAFPIATDVGLRIASRSGQFTAADGMILYQTGGAGRSALAWFDRTGKREADLDDANLYQDLELSPDGKFVASTRLDTKTLNMSVWITDLARGISTRITPETEDVSSPSWSPDGRRIAYVGRTQGSHDLYVQEIANSGVRELVARLAIFPSWSPDGASLLFFEQSRSELELSPVSGGHKQTMYLHGGFRQPAFSPDGHWVAFVSDESGNPEVVVESFPAGRGKWQISRSGGAQPVWRRDGQELFYKSIGENGKVYAVPVKTSPSFEPGSPKELFAFPTTGIADIRRNFTVTPDGQHFLVNMRTDVHPQGILLENWLPRER